MTLVALLLLPAAGAAQGPVSGPGPARTTWPVPATPADSLPSGARLAVGGVLGGAAGFFGLGFLGAWIADANADPGEDLAAVGGFALGALVGEVAGVAAGVHLADGRRGSFWKDLGVSALGALGTVVLVSALDTDGAPAWTAAGAGVAAQVGFTVWTELGSR